MENFYISGSNQVLGSYTDQFSVLYGIFENTPSPIPPLLNVQEKLDGIVIREFSPMFGESLTFQVDTVDFETLDFGWHEVVIIATSESDTLERVYAFNKMSEEYEDNISIDASVGLDFIIPNIQIGIVENLSPGSKPYVTRNIDSENANPILNFGIPRGYNGAGEGMPKAIYSPNYEGELSPKEHSHDGSDITTGTVSANRLPQATTGVIGVTKLNNTLTSETSTEALTAKQGKVLKTEIDNKANDNSVVHLSNNESITGIKTFSVSPVVPTPTAPNEVANKSYVDTVSDQTITSRIASQVEAESGTDNINLMTALGVFQQFQAKSAALTPTISGNATTRDLTVPAGSNPNRMTILLTSGTTATSAIRLRVGTGTYYNIIMPTGSAGDNLLSLKANVPYELIYSNALSRWVCVSQKAQVLYNNASGISSAFSLAANPENYDYLDVTIGLAASTGVSTVRIAAPGAQYDVRWHTISVSTGSLYSWGYWVRLSRSGLNISFSLNARLEYVGGSAAFTRDDNAGASIYKVVAGIY